MQHNLKHKEKEVLFTVKRRRPWRRNGHRNQRRLVLETREEQQQESKSAKSDGRIFSQEFWVRSKKTKQSPQKETKEYRETVKQKKGDKRQSQTRELSKKEWKTHQGWSVPFFFFFKQWSSSSRKHYYISHRLQSDTLCCPVSCLFLIFPLTFTTPLLGP